VSNQLLAVTPVLVPLATALATVLAGERARLQQVLSFAGIAVFLLCASALVAQAVAGTPAISAFGGWPAPFGIEFAVDRLSAVLVLITAGIGAATLLALAGDADPGAPHPLRLPLVHGLLAGVGGAFATADLFNLYVWFEVMLICSLGLLAIGGREDQLDATFKYLALNLFGTLLLLVGVGLVYANTGHLNFAALAATDAVVPAPVLATLVLAFLVKSAAFPLFAWLPASYHTLPGPVAALFAGLLTKVGVYAVLRITGEVLRPGEAFNEFLGWIAAATMVAGVLGAAYHWDIRRILAFHVISQIGYMLLAVALASPEGRAATLFYVVHHIVVKSNLFLIGALVFRLGGSYDLRRVGGLYAARPWLAALFMVPAMSLIGLPPLSGFWAKFLVLRETFGSGHYVWAAIALLVSVLTLYSMLKIWIEAFWKPQPENAQPAEPTGLGPILVATTALAAVTVWIGLAPAALVGYANASAGVAP